MPQGRALRSVQGGQAGNPVQNMGLIPLPEEERFPLFILIAAEIIGLVILRRYIGGHRG